MAGPNAAKVAAARAAAGLSSNGAHEQHQPTNGGHAPAQNGAPAIPYEEMSDSQLLDAVLAIRPGPQRAAPVNVMIESEIKQIEEVLPDPLKPQAKRLVRRAEVTFAKLSQKFTQDVYQCEPKSIVRAVIEAAEIGLPIDGKLCTVIVRSNNKGTRDKPRWVKEAQLSIQYQGLVVVARRSGQITDAWGRVVYSNDRFEAHHRGAEDFLEHDDAYDGDRGTCQGAYAQIIFPDKRWRYEWMQDQQITDEAREHSKSKDDPHSPWNTHTDEMRKKTVLRRILKLYCDDPALGMAIDVDEREYQDEPAQPRRPTSLADRIAAKAEQTEAEPVDDTCQESPPDDVDEPGAYEPDESEVQA